MRRLYPCTLFLLLALAGGQAMAAGSMRCGSRIVDEGKHAAEVLSACGEPDYRDVWSYPGPRGGGWLADVEEWYYNFGSSQLLRVLRLRNGRVVEIGSDGYGFSESAGRRCRPTGITLGVSKYRLLKDCGEPLTRQAAQLLRRADEDRRDPYLSRPGTGSALTPVYREEWVYNFGSAHLLRIITLENGRVSDVQNGDRGFD